VWSGSAWQAKSAEEARAWIEAWRNGGSTGSPQVSSAAEPAPDEGAEGGLPLVADVGDGPLTWLQKLRLPWAQARAAPGIVVSKRSLLSLKKWPCQRRLQTHNHRCEIVRLLAHIARS